LNGSEVFRVALYENELEQLDRKIVYRHGGDAAIEKPDEVGLALADQVTVS
jgi:hypothetical protein